MLPLFECLASTTSASRKLSALPLESLPGYKVDTEWHLELGVAKEEKDAIHRHRHYTVEYL